LSPHAGERSGDGHDAVPGDPGTGSPAGPGTPAGARPRRVWVLAAVAAFVLIADVVSKTLVVANLSGKPPLHLIGGVLMFTELRNSGAAFGIGTGDTIVFTAIALAVIIYIVRTARNLRSLGWAITLGLLLGGAAGNLGDRVFRAPGLFRGHVVDWIEVTRWWPVFNLADSAIVCGGVLTVLLALRRIRLDGARDAGPAASRSGAPGRQAASSLDPSDPPANPASPSGPAPHSRSVPAGGPAPHSRSAPAGGPAPHPRKSDISGHADLAADLET